MANSKYEYVKAFEQSDVLLPNTWIVVRIDGRGFHRSVNRFDGYIYLIISLKEADNELRFSNRYRFEKPNDPRALNLMNAAAKEVMKELPDLVIAYGVSDEFSFVFHQSCQLFERRSSKLMTTVASSFTAHYIHQWSSFFPDTPLEPVCLPTFDGRAIQYPSVINLRDYMSWRQVDCHINNLYNTTFWTMVQQGGLSNADAERELKGTVSSDKNEILFSKYGINYNNEQEMYKKGSVLFREYELQNVQGGSSSKEKHLEEEAYEQDELSKTQTAKRGRLQRKANITIAHIDIIKDDFWEERPWILSNKPGKLPATAGTS